MKIRLAALVASVALVLGVFGGVASADNGGANGQAVGQDPAQLAETRCANAGTGNGGEVVDADDDDLDCVKQQGKEGGFNDRDPGNSGDHNNAPKIPPGQAP